MNVENERNDTDRLIPKYLEKKLPQCHFFYHIAYPTLESLGLNSRVGSEKPATNRQSHDKAG